MGSSLDTLIVNSSAFLVTTRREVVWNRRFGTTDPIFKSQAVQEAWLLKMGHTCSPETSV